MTTTVAIPPDWSDHAWQPLVLPTHIDQARYTTRPDWSSDGESMWMRVSKFSLFNRLPLHALASLVAVRASEASSGGVDFRRADRFVPSRLCSLLEIAEAAVPNGFCLPSAHPALTWAATELRYCPGCLEQGFHAAWFQWRFVERCPTHGSRLRSGCHKCAAVIPYALDSSLTRHPLSCSHCGTFWVRQLNRPAGRCVPVKGRLARIFKRWQIHLADAMMPVIATPFPSCAPATGKVARQRAAGIEIRMTGLARCIQMLNRLYDVPPPSLVELSGRYRVELDMVEKIRPAPSPGEGSGAEVIAWASADWPHFDNDFREYERVLKHVGRDLFGDTCRIALTRLPLPDRYGAMVIHTQDVNADLATALGWSISWYGFSRTFAPEREPHMPAMGLTGWLAHAPHRPAECPPEQWREQMSAWLAHDLARSARAWTRIVRFMRAREKYLFHALLMRPAELARLHSPFQDGTPSCYTRKNFEEIDVVR
ncbi:hypothetical protein [Robbsia andropogonis]|uniref:hypothetical protein n=1 Tax=Robbsia andropogonis TaxID=28092 RepID=UPI002A69D291|nr:hypothetical protein [Robbsia andropogonis]